MASTPWYTNKNWRALASPGGFCPMYTDKNSRVHLRLKLARFLQKSKFLCLTFYCKSECRIQHETSIFEFLQTYALASGFLSVFSINFIKSPLKSHQKPLEGWSNLRVRCGTSQKNANGAVF